MHLLRPLFLILLLSTTGPLICQITVGTMKIGQGVTEPEDWQDYSLQSSGWEYDGVYVDVNTEGCGFTTTPHYLVTLESKYTPEEQARAGSGMWETSGYTAIYRPTPTGFRVIARWTDGELDRPGRYTPTLTAQQARDFGYVIRWTAITTGDCSSCADAGDATGDNGTGEEDPTSTNLAPVGVEIEKPRLDLFPNPTGSELNVGTDAELFGLSLYGSDGSLIGHFPPTNKIDITTLSVGTYVLHATFADGVMVAKKFIKQ